MEKVFLIKSNYDYYEPYTSIELLFVVAGINLSLSQTYVAILERHVVNNQVYLMYRRDKGRQSCRREEAHGAHCARDGWLGQDYLYSGECPTSLSQSHLYNLFIYLATDKVPERERQGDVQHKPGSRGAEREFPSEHRHPRQREVQVGDEGVSAWAQWRHTHLSQHFRCSV